jgi:hypothetical protein
MPLVERNDRIYSQRFPRPVRPADAPGDLIGRYGPALLKAGPLAEPKRPNAAA